MIVGGMYGVAQGTLFVAIHVQPMENVQDWRLVFRGIIGQAVNHRLPGLLIT